MWVVFSHKINGTRILERNTAPQRLFLQGLTDGLRVRNKSQPALEINFIFFNPPKGGKI